MSKSIPFSKRSGSQYKKPDFYWRGGDVLREKEYLADEYKKALVDYKQAEKENNKLLEELQQAKGVLEEREGYTAALAQFLEGDADASRQESELKLQLNELQYDIQDAEAEFAEAKAVHHPAVFSSLQKEKAYLAIEMQRNSKGIQLHEEKKDQYKRQIASISISPKYQSAINNELRLHQLSRRKTALRQLVNTIKAEFENTRTVIQVQDEEAGIERSAQQARMKVKLELDMAKETLNSRPLKHKTELQFYMQQIEDLNERLLDLRLEPINVEELRTRYQNKL